MMVMVRSGQCIQWSCNLSPASGSSDCQYDCTTVLRWLQTGELFVWLTRLILLFSLRTLPYSSISLHSFSLAVT